MTDRLEYFVEGLTTQIAEVRLRGEQAIRRDVLVKEGGLSDRQAKALGHILANQGVPTKIDVNHTISHNKVIIIDGELVIAGSFNFTKAAQNQNAENLLIIRDQTLAAQYTQNWQAHRQHSQPYVGRGVRQ